VFTSTLPTSSYTESTSPTQSPPTFLMHTTRAPWCALDDIGANARNSITKYKHPCPHQRAIDIIPAIAAINLYRQSHRFHRQSFKVQHSPHITLRTQAHPPLPRPPLQHRAQMPCTTTLVLPSTTTYHNPHTTPAAQPTFSTAQPPAPQSNPQSRNQQQQQHTPIPPADPNDPGAITICETDSSSHSGKGAKAGTTRARAVGDVPGEACIVEGRFTMASGSGLKLGLMPQLLR